MDTWIQNVHNSEYLQQQLIADYYKQFAIVLDKKIKSFENNELNSFKSLKQKDLDNLLPICDEKIKFLEKSLGIRQSFYLTENLRKDQLKVFWWKVLKNKYSSSFTYRLIHYFPIFLFVGLIAFKIVDLVIVTNLKQIEQIQQKFDSQISQVKNNWNNSSNRQEK